MSNNSKNIFLFSLDLEDVRENVVNGFSYKDRVVENTRLYLNWLRKYNSACTFFTVGKIAERNPDLIKEIVDHGHEIACHSYSHITINKFNKATFKEDLAKNIEALNKAGAKDIKGFRAPVFSLTKNTEWAYDALKEMGLTYSSSVLPASNPLFGWPEFGAAPKNVGGILEIPMSVGKFASLKFPAAGGVYFRVFPFMVIRNNISEKFKNKLPLLSYFHPYDADVYQEKFMHDGINNSKFYNRLMYFNRKNLFKRLDKVMQMNCSIIRYDKYLEEFKNGNNL